MCLLHPRFVTGENELLPSPSAQTTTPSKTASSLLDFLISCHKGKEVEPWTVFNITPEEVQTVWSMLQRHKPLYDYVLGKFREVNRSSLLSLPRRVIADPHYPENHAAGLASATFEGKLHTRNLYCCHLSW